MRDKRLAMLTKLHELESDRAVMIWVVHVTSIHVPCRRNFPGSVQARNWFQDLTPIVVNQ